MKTTALHAQTAFVSCQALSVVDWKPGADCGFADELAVFRMAIPPLPAVAARFDSLLTPADRIRADRYHRPVDRLRFVGGRGLLRTVAGNYTQQPPQEMYITLGLNNKPELGNAPELCVNISHAGQWLLLVVGRAPVGIDVEIIQEVIDYELLMNTGFTIAEQHEISQNAHPRRVFYDYWTRKEALLKATGLGLTDDLCRVPARNGAHPVSAAVLGASGAWVVQSFSVDARHPAAVAHRPDVTEPVFYTFMPDYFC